MAPVFAGAFLCRGALNKSEFGVRRDKGRIVILADLNRSAFTVGGEDERRFPFAVSAGQGIAKRKDSLEQNVVFFHAFSRKRHIYNEKKCVKYKVDNYIYQNGMNRFATIALAD